MSKRVGRPTKIRLPPDPLPASAITKTDFARLLNCPPSRISEWVRHRVVKGAALTPDGLVLPQIAAEQLLKVGAILATAASVDGTAARNAQAALALLDAQGVFLTRAEAERHSASYVALLRQIEYEEKCGTIARVDDMKGALGAALARVRTRLSAIPVEAASELHRKKTVPEVVEELRRVINEALEELCSADGFAKP